MKAITTHNQKTFDFKPFLRYYIQSQIDMKNRYFFIDNNLEAWMNGWIENKNLKYMDFAAFSSISPRKN